VNWSLGSEGEGLSRRVGRLLRQRHLSLAVAESCTGGLLGSLITDVSGSSDYFLGGVIAYANAIKEQLLAVKPETLAAHGAVSREVALEMAEGARRSLGADLALAITGIAGPGGGTPQKPVGLTYIALAAEGCSSCLRYEFGGGRQENKAASVRAALEMLGEFLTELG
jgi:nicotinamide-nucleotide amidase